jgi:hypothetical protein
MWIRKKTAWGCVRERIWNRISWRKDVYLSRQWRRKFFLFQDLEGTKLEEKVLTSCCSTVSSWLGLSCDRETSNMFSFTLTERRVHFPTRLREKRASFSVVNCTFLGLVSHFSSCFFAWSWDKHMLLEKKLSLSKYPIHSLDQTTKTTTIENNLRQDLKLLWQYWPIKCTSEIIWSVVNWFND